MCVFCCYTSDSASDPLWGSRDASKVFSSVIASCIVFTSDITKMIWGCLLCCFLAPGAKIASYDSVGVSSIASGIGNRCHIMRELCYIFPLYNIKVYLKAELVWFCNKSTILQCKGFVFLQLASDPTRFNLVLKELPSLDFAVLLHT